MFLSIDQVSESLGKLASVHPFFATTFLVCKINDLPVGESIPFPIGAAEAEFLDEYYKPYKNSRYYYRVFSAISDRKRAWLSHKYPSSTLQAMRTRGDLAQAFIHTRGSDDWGWEENYIQVLEAFLEAKNLKRVPVFDLAVWLFRERDWNKDTTPTIICDIFLKEYMINEEEMRLFDLSLPPSTSPHHLFNNESLNLVDLKDIIGKPPDAPPEEGGTLEYLQISGVGPAKNLTLEPGERLTLVTGDNGLGKTFLLECAWWALSGEWAGLPAHPRRDTRSRAPKITFHIAAGSTTEKRTVFYDWATQTWPFDKGRPTIPGLLIYARVDGSFAVWDPAKDYWSLESGESESSKRPFVFTKDQVWDGKEERIDGKSRFYINGLLRDLINWQYRPDRYPFDTFKQVLKRLSPRDLGELQPGEPVRLPYDVREIPSLKHPYGEVPIVHAAAGVQRIVALAYLIVWAWHEHQTQSDLIRKKPQQRMVVLIDEIEAHLHPLWQRAMLPALLDIADVLSAELQVQFIVATHSPLVLASVESRFNEDIDSLFHLNLISTGRDANQVELQELGFVKYGRVDSWLMSEIFELGSARSIEAEQAISQAKALQLEDTPNPESIRAVSLKLLDSLAVDDEFWPRWKYFAERHRVKI